MPGNTLLQGRINGRSSADVERFAARVADLINLPLTTVTWTVTAEVGNTRRFTGQVRDRLHHAWQQRCVVRAYLSSTETGDPVGTQTVAFISGTVLATLLPHGHWEVLTAVDGSFSFDALIVGAATRYAHGLVLGPAAASHQADWT